MDEAGTAEYRDQNYQNPLNLLQDNAFVAAVLVLCFIAILEIIIGFLYSTYCSYPMMMHSDASRRRVQYCAMAGGLGQYEQTIYEQTIRSQDDVIKTAQKESLKLAREEFHDYSVPPEIQPLPIRTRRNSVDIQSVLSSIISDYEDEKDAVSITSNDDSIYGEEDTAEFSSDKVANESNVRGPNKLFQHSRAQTLSSTNSTSKERGKKIDLDNVKYSQV